MASLSPRKRRLALVTQRACTLVVVLAGVLIEQHRLLAFRHRVHIVLGHHAFADIRPRRYVVHRVKQELFQNRAQPPRACLPAPGGLGNGPQGPIRQIALEGMDTFFLKRNLRLVSDSS